MEGELHGGYLFKNFCLLTTESPFSFPSSVYKMHAGGREITGQPWRYHSHGVARSI